MAGPTYHYDSAVKSPLRLPASYDGRVFIYDWMRNWIKTVRLDEQGKPDRIEPFLPQHDFPQAHRPEVWAGRLPVCD